LQFKKATAQLVFLTSHLSTAFANHQIFHPEPQRPFPDHHISILLNIRYLM
jgi:hypothetical protein